MQKKIKQAVSVILKYQDIVYLIKRQNHLKAFPGYTSFPGGKVDKLDSTSSDEMETFRKTGIREIEEELGIDISQSISKVPYAKATSPDFNPVRFETYFFIAELGEMPILKEDKYEIAKSFWVKPKDLLAEFEEGKHLMVRPVRAVLESLLEKSDNTTTDYLDLNDKKTDIPCIEPMKNLLQYMPLSNTVPPAQRTNCFVIGDKLPILIDPSPKNIEEYELFLNEIRRHKISKIIISHHHKDHHQFSTHLARDLSLPIFISRDSSERILSKYGESYFKGVEVNIIRDGDVIGNWLGQKIICHAIPGHDEGHFGFSPKCLTWFIVGDLFQGIGTVVVGGEESDMSKYMSSLQKVIALNPKCVIPSHGIALGGTNILQKTYKHRLLREQQVQELYNSGVTIEEILTQIYFDLPTKLMPYARANIQSHITKLKQENKLSTN